MWNIGDADDTLIAAQINQIVRGDLVNHIWFFFLIVT